MTAQFEHYLLARLVFNGAQLLQRHQAAGFQFVFGKVSPAKHVGIDFQRGKKILGERGAAEAGMGVRDTIRRARRPGCPDR